jgi:cysteinyl-tRNA synthetase
MLSLYNSLSKQKESFHPLTPGHVGLYTCGPTVYDYAHIGNLRTYIFEDILKRVLKYHNYQVNHVMNITDVGHLTDDADNGEDKMEKGSKREGKTAWEIAEFYTQKFQENLKDLNILEPSIWCKATDHIPEQIAMVQTLTEKGYTYTTSDGIYFDTTKNADYGKLVDLQNQELQAGARVDMGEKKNPHDFALWKFTPEGEKRQMEWNAFGRMGFPGWHIECSAMASKYLGEQFDIHCGGIDHKPVHHTNEIAQTESATGIVPWVKVWMHGEFLNDQSGKMSKSKGDFLTLEVLKEKGFDPLAYRYFLLSAHYRKQLSFSFEALEAAQNGLNNLRRKIAEIPDHVAKDQHHSEAFLAAINDDLNMPEALAVVWNGVKEGTLSIETIIHFDKVLGLNLHQPKEAQEPIPTLVQKLLEERITAREAKDFKRSDELREKIQAEGYELEDTKDGQKVKRK